MFSDSVLSCCLLFLASGSCVYLSGRWSFDLNLFSELPPEIIAASTGVLAINLRSTFNLLAPFYFHAEYSIDPLEVDEEEEEKIELRSAPLVDKFFRTISNVGLIFAVCEAHNNRKRGVFITLTLIFAESYHALFANYRKKPLEKFFNFLWMLAGASYGWMKGNIYCFLAYVIPYWTAFLEFGPERDYIWSVPRIINNYMMLAHVLLMFEAIRVAHDINSTLLE